MKSVTIAMFAFTGFAECINVGLSRADGNRIAFPGPSHHSAKDLAETPKKSADLAESATASQDIAAKRVSYETKNNLAETATRAAENAHAVFTGKQVLLHSLEEQMAQAQHMFQGEIEQLRLAQIAAAEAATSAEKAAIHVSVLSVALGSAKNAAAHADEAAKETANEVASQSDMVTSAKYYLQSLEERLHAARIEFAATQTAAERASVSAHQAHQNAEHERMNLPSETNAPPSNKEGKQMQEAKELNTSPLTPPAAPSPPNN